MNSESSSIAGKIPMQTISGWGRTQRVRSKVINVTSTLDSDHISPVLANSDGDHVISRGLGRSYGDAAQIAGGTVIILNDDINGSAIGADGALRVSGGTSLDAIMKKYVPQGYFVPVTPGTRYVTVGGAIAADIHGKNHHVSGSFANHLHNLKLIAPQDSFDLSPTENPEIFWATVGGMGLTGVIANATVRMLPIETSYISMETRRAKDLDELLAIMAGSDDDFRYSVAWIDCLSKGAAMGRGVLTRGDHTSLDALPKNKRTDPLKFKPNSRLVAPDWFPPHLLNPLSVRAFNEVWFRKAPRLRQGEVVPLSTFFHPLDGVQGWNKIYGRYGFLQYQFVIPDGEEETLRKIMGKISNANVASFLAVLKRFGESNSGLLSFPKRGWTLALDIPIGSSTLSSLLDELDKDVLEANGRLYLAKESRASRETIRAMYPRLKEFAEIKARLDPKGIIVSDLSRRLCLT